MSFTKLLSLFSILLLFNSLSICESEVVENQDLQNGDSISPSIRSKFEKRATCTCGNGICDPCENQTLCCLDCGCNLPNSNSSCVNGVCKISSCTSNSFKNCNNYDADGCEANLLTSVLNCGNCSNSCPDVANAVTTCVNGSCKVTCLISSQIFCIDRCIDKNVDPFNCGGCGNNCNNRAGVHVGTCQAGKCQIECDTNSLDCDGDQSNGCEKVKSNITTCGSCNNNCALLPNVQSTSCTSFQCVINSCKPGFADCDNIYSNGCESSLTSVSNCKNCNTSCSGQNVKFATCNQTSGCNITCESGFSDCNGNLSDWCETDLMNSPKHCGSCSNDCNRYLGSGNVQSMVCIDGACVAICNPGFADCNNTLTDGCEADLNNSVYTCGSCNENCYDNSFDNVGTLGCNLGMCEIVSCFEGYEDCDTIIDNGCEADLFTDINNCGNCSNVCSTSLQHSEAFCEGTCYTQCIAPYDDCNKIAGCETNLQNTTSSCGVCANNCSLYNFTNNTQSVACSNYNCVLTCNPGYGDCDGDLTNGCESDFLTTSSACSSCDINCMSLPNVASAVCENGICNITACGIGFDNCDGIQSTGCETALNTISRCGGCNSSCTQYPNTNVVCGGEGNSCMYSCQLGYSICDGGNECSFNIWNDTENCGTCNYSCSGNQNAASSFCNKGKCEYNCLAGFLDCDEFKSGCETPSNLTNNCGACGFDCNALDNISVGGANCILNSQGKNVCNFTCSAGFSDCDNLSYNGCETPGNCYTCPNSCASMTLPNNTANVFCNKSGQCAVSACNPGYGDCDFSVGNGCESSLNSSKACGNCSNSCLALPNVSPNSVYCDQGNCIITGCLDGYLNCNGDPDDGCEIQLSEQNCGCQVCGNHQNAKSYCNEFPGAAPIYVCSYLCNASFLDCNEGIDGCESSDTSIYTCGNCGNDCTSKFHTEDVSCNQYGVCIFGSCNVSTYENCDGDVTNGCETPLNNTENCGACGRSCITDQQTFVSSVKCDEQLLQCTIVSCYPPYADADGNFANGCESDISSDPQNCGGVGNSCFTTNVKNATCEDGFCSLIECNSGYLNCDNDNKNGCETTMNETNCGICGNTCIKVNALNASCVNNSCQFGCKPGYVDCSAAYDGCEANIATDPKNCGVCGNDCSIFPNTVSVLNKCIGGSCSIKCTEGKDDCDRNVNNGCEADLLSTTTCGSCSKNCSNLPNVSSVMCSFGYCKILNCTTGYRDCDLDPSNGCETSINTTSHCNSCFNSCTSTNILPVCTPSGCGIANTCVPGFANCNGLPLDGCEVSLANVSSCGNCTTDCKTIPNSLSVACSQTNCAVKSCNPPFADCDTVIGCETNLATDANNCGACGHSCTFPGFHVNSSNCNSGACVITSCSPGYLNCDSNSLNGCEVDALNDISNCKTCNTKCNLTRVSPQTCSAGECIVNNNCISPWLNCNGVDSDGCEINSNTNVQYCGACNRTCSSNNGNATCINGACNIQCNTGFSNCDNNTQSNGCEVNLRNDTNNCGNCSTKCSSNNGNATCINGTCTIQCNTGFGNCDLNAQSNGCEANLQNNTNRCGSCNTTCSSNNGNATCINGACNIQCNNGFGNCDNNTQSNGCEVNLRNDKNNCGNCSTTCSSTNGNATCTNGTCTIQCNTGFGNCDLNAQSNGCEVNLRNDTNNCGSCGTKCSSTNGNATCINGTCTIQCNTGFGNCDLNAQSNGCEVNFQNNTDYCGNCSTKCSSNNGNATCSNGTCTIQCNNGFGNCDLNAQSNGCEINLQNNTNYCGNCNSNCSIVNGVATCTSGICTIIQCNTNFNNCDGNVTNGCEINILTDSNHCGNCSNACNQYSICNNGVCKVTNCPFPYLRDCNGYVNDTCEVNISNDTNNCGTCGNVCIQYANAVAVTCVNAQCQSTCDARYGDCDGNYQSGCETDLYRNVTHCGACTNDCNQYEVNPNVASGVCAIGQCDILCKGGYKNCDGDITNGCEVNLQDITSCGDCNNNCSALVSNSSLNIGTVSCANGACKIGSCAAGFGNCNGLSSDGCEASLLVDEKNCLRCGNDCGNLPFVTAANCTDGQCSTLFCDYDYANCDNDVSNGCETSLSADTTCGGCNIDCTNLSNVFSASCLRGVCNINQCSPTFGNCDFNIGNGCETKISNDTENCGVCGNSCIPHTLENTRDVVGADYESVNCIASNCIYKCPAGFADCDRITSNRCEVDLYTDVNNCGGCGIKCEVCSNGRCVSPSPKASPSIIDRTVTASPSESSSTTYSFSASFTPITYPSAPQRPSVIVPTHTASTSLSPEMSYSPTASIQRSVSPTPSVSTNLEDACENAECGNGECEVECGETSSLCCEDCEFRCGDGVCNERCGEESESCCFDCGYECGDGICSYPCEIMLTCCDCYEWEKYCGDGECGLCEDKERCNEDCKLDCETGMADCNNNEDDGCETTLMNTTTHCGGCNVNCNSQLENVEISICIAGRCNIDVCKYGYDNCDERVENGCETNLLYSPLNCGVCGNYCILDHATSVCNLGFCVLLECQENFFDVDGNASNGCEFYNPGQAQGYSAVTEEDGGQQNGQSGDNNVGNNDNNVNQVDIPPLPYNTNSKCKTCGIPPDSASYKISSNDKSSLIPIEGNGVSLGNLAFDHDFYNGYTLHIGPPNGDNLVAIISSSGGKLVSTVFSIELISAGGDSVKDLSESPMGICFTAETTLSEGCCLAFFDPVEKVWECESDVTIMEDQLCGLAPHLTDFALLLTGGYDKKKKDEPPVIEWLSFAFGVTALVIVIVAVALYEVKMRKAKYNSKKKFEEIEKLYQKSNESHQTSSLNTV